MDNQYVKLADADLVFDVSFWKMEPGNTVNFVGGTSTKAKTKQGGGGRDFVLNSDGTISCKHRPDLVLGTNALEPDPVQMEPESEIAVASLATAPILAVAVPLEAKPAFVDSKAPSKKFCSSCGKPLEGGEKFCPHCGTKM
jgi:hypothetical protein